MDPVQAKISLPPSWLEMTLGLNEEEEGLMHWMLLPIYFREMEGNSHLAQ